MLPDDAAVEDALKMNALEFVYEMRQLIDPAAHKHRVLAAHPGDSIECVASIMTAAHVHQLFVVDEERRPVGTVTLGDIVGLLAVYSGPRAGK